jgi:DNA-binding NtrC family response regulator
MGDYPVNPNGPNRFQGLYDKKRAKEMSKKTEIEAFVEKKVSELKNVNYYLQKLDLEDKNNRLENENRYLKEEIEKLENLKDKSLKELDALVGSLSLYELEKEFIKRSLLVYGGNKTQTASALGITIKTLYNKLHEYGDV